jgi:hypothetical protein
MPSAGSESSRCGTADPEIGCRFRLKINLGQAEENQRKTCGTFASGTSDGLAYFWRAGPWLRSSSTAPFEIASSTGICDRTDPEAWNQARECAREKPVPGTSAAASVAALAAFMRSIGDTCPDCD